MLQGSSCFVEAAPKERFSPVDNPEPSEDCRHSSLALFCKLPLYANEHEACRYYNHSVSGNTLQWCSDVCVSTRKQGFRNCILWCCNKQRLYCKITNLVVNDITCLLC